MKRYVQYHVLPSGWVSRTPEGTVVEPFDGVGAAWWDDFESMRRDVDENPDLTEAIEAEKLFVDQERSMACLSNERIIVEPRGSVPYVLIEGLRRRSDIDRESFQERWFKHSVLGRRAYEMGLLQGYIQHHTWLENDPRIIEALGPMKETWDGVTTVYDDSAIRLKLLLASDLAAQESFKDEKTFLDHNKSATIIARRHVILDVVR
jgi:hypothetical protein